MLNNLIIGTIVYNEENRFLKQYLEKISKLSNKLLFIDDGSTDNTVSILSQYTSNIFQMDRQFEKDESIIRKAWWDNACKIANENDFILILDCDEFLTNNSINHFEEQLKIGIKLDCDALGMWRYDMWNKQQYREDNIWKSHIKSWISCIKYNKYKTNKYPYWYNMKLHGGSYPINYYQSAYASLLQVQHMAYSSLELRKEKVKFYEHYDNNKNSSMQIQYNSILDENPTLIDFKDNFEDTK